MPKSLKERLAVLEGIASKDRTSEQSDELKQVRADIAKEDAVRAKKDAEDKAEMDKLRAENKEHKRVAEINSMADMYKASTEVREKAIADKTVDGHAFARSILDAKAKETSYE